MATSSHGPDSRLDPARQAVHLLTLRWILSLPVVFAGIAIWLPVFERAQSSIRKVVTLPGLAADPNTLEHEGRIAFLGWSYVVLVAVCIATAALTMASSRPSTRVLANRITAVAGALGVVAVLVLWLTVANLDPAEIDVHGAIVAVVVAPAWFLGAALASMRAVADIPESTRG